MTSIINTILQQQCDKYTKQEQWIRGSKHVENIKDKHERVTQLGKYFLSALLIESISGTSLPSALSKDQFKNLQNNLLNAISCKYKFAPQKICHFIGSFFEENLLKISNFQQMRDQIKTILYLIDSGHYNSNQSQNNDDDEDDIEESLNFQCSEFIGNDSVSSTHKNFNSTTDSKNQNILQFMNKEEDDIIICDSFDYPSSPVRTKAQDLQIQNYLIKLGGPANEVTYIAQHCNMRLADYRATAIGINKFQTTVTMQFKFDKLKIPKTIFNNKCVTKGKKSGKYLASLLLLKNIYTQCPQFWEYFKALKKQKNIILPMQADNSTILAESEKQPQPQQQKIEEQSQAITPLYEKAIHDYMEQIKSYKAQLNYLTQQVKHITLTNKKLQDKNLWMVKSDLTIEMNGIKDKMTEQISLNNSKKAEQENIKALLTKMYLKYPIIWNKWKKIKQSKGLWS